MPKPIKSSSRYMAGLDGLRAVAVIGVIFYHLNLSFLPGGFLGVGVFFVLSGYLITNLISAEWERNKKVDFENFMIRRARRLFPALLIMVVLVMCYVTIFLGNRLQSIKGDAISSILYYNNWYLIFRHVSYFAKFGPPSPFGHMWSLSVEGQFYMIWPILLILAFRYIKKNNLLFLLTLGLSLASVVTMALLYKPGMDPSRVYYGTDTRAFALLIGSALALIWPSRKLKMDIKRINRIFLESIGIIGLITIIIMFFVINEYDPFLYQGGMFILSIATALLIASLAHPSTWLGKALGCKPLKWLGARSYGIYLWHFPIIALTNPLVNTNGINIWRAIMQITASILLAAISWKYVEGPIRHGVLNNIKLQFKLKLNDEKGFKNILKGITLKAWVTLTALILVIGVFLIGITGIAPFASTSTVAERNKYNGQVISKKVQTNGSKSSLNEDVGEKPTPHNITVNDQNKKTNTENTNTNNDKTSTNNKDIQDCNGITLIGDSISLDTEPYFKKLLPGIVVDGKVGRQLYQAQDVVNQLKANGELGKKVIIELGTNGSFTEKQLTDLIKSLGSTKQIILVNVRVPRPWERLVNDTLAKVASKYPHVTLVDWYKASAGHNSFFSPDAVHLEPSGAEFYADLVAKSIMSN